jgi:hypothetical protein
VLVSKTDRITARHLHQSNVASCAEAPAAAAAPASEVVAAYLANTLAWETDPQRLESAAPVLALLAGKLSCLQQRHLLLRQAVQHIAPQYVCKYIQQHSDYVYKDGDQPAHCRTGALALYSWRETHMRVVQRD